jgi:hypothetical protein
MKIIACALIASLALPSAAIAGPYDYQGRDVYHNYDRDYERHVRYERHGDRWVVPALAGLIIGAAIVSSTHKDSDYRQDPRTVNQDEVYRQPAPRTYVYDYKCDCYR